MKITMMLADFAQVVDGKLYIMGGGWTMTGPTSSPSAIAIKVEVPWTEANRKHKLQVALVDSDYNPVLVPTPGGNVPLVINAEFEVGRPPGMIPGSPLSVPMALNIGPVPLVPGARYVWKLTIDGNSNDDWQVTFSTRPPLATPTP
ncbi:MAG: hypothetical protein HY552_01265 [Elusimicrobia bacterium]|nr:hypothetical protein [Elusimicrobiota bacterium]